MRHVGLSFCVAFVLTLSLLLVPALTPPAALADEVADLPNPLTVNFTATVDEGAAYPFTVLPDPGFGSVINQFTRHWMVIYPPDNVTNARFFNMSTAPGAISGDLSGSIDFKWNRFDFATPYLPAEDRFIASPTGVGILYINATVTGTILGDLTVIGAADLDYNSTLVKGEGIVWTVEDFAKGATNETGGAPDRVLVGEMIYEYVVSTGAMTGTFNLRNYSKHPVGLEGQVETTVDFLWLEGQLIDDDSDDITYDVVKFNQFTRDPVMTDPDPDNRIVLEEMTVGREEDQKITAGDSGVGGTISLLRTGVLDVFPVGEIDIPVNAVTGTRTIENNTGSNMSSKRGRAYTIVLVDMVDFGLETGISQQACTIMPGYSYDYMGTGYYAGFESYVLAATSINLTLWLSGPDYRYALLPTPVVSSVDPDEGWVGNTLPVTINGKWFTTNTSYHPLNISFGAGVTADWLNCTVLNDTAVKVNITIDSDAMVYPRDVSVTKRGVTGTLTGGFNVKGPTGTLQGQVTFKRKKPAGCTTWITPLVVTFFDNSTRNLLYTEPVTTDAWGNFTLVVGRGTYDIGVKNWTTLSNMSCACGKGFTAGNTTTINFNCGDKLIEGDTDNNDWIKLNDFTRVLVNFNAKPGEAGWDPMYDFDRSGKVDLADFTLVLVNFNKKGDILKYPPCP